MTTENMESDFFSFSVVTTKAEICSSHHLQQRINAPDIESTHYYQYPKTEPGKTWMMNK